MFEFTIKAESADVQKALQVADNAISGMLKSDYQQQDIQRESMQYNQNKEQLTGLFDGIKNLFGPFVPLLLKFLEKESGLVRIPKVSDINDAFARMQADLDAAKQRIHELSEANQALLVQLDKYENGNAEDTESATPEDTESATPDDTDPDETEE